MVLPLPLAASNLSPFLDADLLRGGSEPLQCSSHSLSFQEMFQENCLQCIVTGSPDAIIDGELSLRCKVRSKEVAMIDSTFSCHTSFLLL